MSIATELSRLLGLRQRLTSILQGKSIIGSGDHDLEDDVIAVENLNYTFQTKSITLGQSAPNPNPITPDNGYDGLARVNVAVSGISGSQIVQDHKILGIPGTAVYIENLKKVYWTFSTSYNYWSSVTLESSGASCYPAGSFTPGSALPDITSINYDKELIIIRTGRGSGTPSKTEINFGIAPYDQGSNRYMQTISNGPTLSYPGNEFTLSMNSNKTNIIITLPGNVKFYGTYLIQVAYR